MGRNGDHVYDHQEGIFTNYNILGIMEKQTGLRPANKELWLGLSNMFQLKVFETTLVMRLEFTTQIDALLYLKIV